MYRDEEEAHEDDTSHDARHILNTVLSFMCFGLNVGMTVNVKNIVMQTISYNEIKRAHILLLQLSADINPEKKHNLRNKDWGVSDIVGWLLDLEKGSVPCVDVAGIALLPRFNVEEITELAMCDRLRRIKTHVARIDESMSQYTVDICDLKLLG